MALKSIFIFLQVLQTQQQHPLLMLYLSCWLKEKKGTRKWMVRIWRLRLLQVRFRMNYFAEDLLHKLKELWYFCVFVKFYLGF